MAKDVDVSAKLEEAALILGRDLEDFRQMPRITKAGKDDRDILVLSIWKTGLLTNDEIGSLFGMTYSSVSYIVRSIKMKIEQDADLKDRFNH